MLLWLLHHLATEQLGLKRNKWNQHLSYSKSYISLYLNVSYLMHVSKKYITQIVGSRLRCHTTNWNLPTRSKNIQLRACGQHTKAYIYIYIQTQHDVVWKEVASIDLRFLLCCQQTIKGTDDGLHTAPVTSSAIKDLLPRALWFSKTMFETSKQLLTWAVSLCACTKVHSVSSGSANKYCRDTNLLGTATPASIGAKRVVIKKVRLIHQNHLDRVNIVQKCLCLGRMSAATGLQKTVTNILTNRSIWWHHNAMHCTWTIFLVFHASTSLVSTTSFRLVQVISSSNLRMTCG